MGLVKIFGIMDFFAIIVLLLLHFGWVPWRFGLLFGVYLIFKAIAFWGNLHSFIDGAIGVYMLLMLIGFHSILTYIAALYLLQKVGFSFIT